MWSGWKKKLLADQIEDIFGYIHESVLELKESGLSIEIEEIESLVLSLDTLYSAIHDIVDVVAAEHRGDR